MDPAHPLNIKRY